MPTTVLRTDLLRGEWMELTAVRPPVGCSGFVTWHVRWRVGGLNGMALCTSLEEALRLADEVSPIGQRKVAPGNVLPGPWRG